MVVELDVKAIEGLNRTIMIGLKSLEIWSCHDFSYGLNRTIMIGLKSSRGESSYIFYEIERDAIMLCDC
jgi:hypothetical protein